MPLTELWNSSGSLDARRAESVGETEIVQLLRDGSSFVVVGRGVRVTVSTVEQSADYL